MNSDFYNFTTEKTLVKSFLAIKFYLSTGFRNFCGTFLRLCGFKRIRSHLVGGVSVQGDMLKGSFERMV